VESTVHSPEASTVVPPAAVGKAREFKNVPAPPTWREDPNIAAPVKSSVEEAKIAPVAFIVPKVDDGLLSWVLEAVPNILISL
jgi:hypothetical protein